MLCAYFDETGHSSDETQHFNGMAGFLARDTDWKRLEEKWKATLKLFAIPFFHMKDFAHCKGHFTDWNESKRRRLLGKLLTHLESIRPIPIGVIFDMNDFRSLPPDKLEHLTEPYLLSCSAMLSLTTGMLDIVGAKTPAKMVFSDQVEFRPSALKYYRYAAGRDENIRRLIAPPEFQEMRDKTPLQAADLFAYELYKECARRLNKPNQEPRHGFQVITRMSNRLGWAQPGFKFVTKWDLLDFVNASQDIDRRLKYWRQRRDREGARN